jgi:hypothetical protein
MDAADWVALVIGTAGALAGLAALVPATAVKARIALAVICVVLIAAAVTIALLAPAKEDADGLSGTIDSPNDGADVQSCEFFRGTAKLTDGKTLVLAKQNLTTGVNTRYVEYVQHWREPNQLKQWNGAQFFGANDDSVGQDYQVELLAVDLKLAERNVNAADFGNGLASTGTSLAKIRVHRVPGTVPANCTV